MIHPLEAFLYYCILYAPAFLLPAPLTMSPAAFSVYMLLHGICGVLDHSGVRFDCGIYSSADHDLHHERFNCNYGFPVPWLDWLHGTYAVKGDAPVRTGDSPVRKADVSADVDNTATAATTTITAAKGVS
jgi:sterol desaturase/sphingolipid hydroxylase (fatty acid hydroxylase superfamily)